MRTFLLYYKYNFYVFLEPFKKRITVRYISLQK